MADIEAAASTAGPYGVTGAIVFAAIRLGPKLVQIAQLLYAIWEQREVELEKDERRARKRRRIESTQPPMKHSQMPSLDSIPEFVGEESTGLHDVREDVRKRAPGGFRAPRPGTHHDGKKE